MDTVRAFCVHRVRFLTTSALRLVLRLDIPDHILCSLLTPASDQLTSRRASVAYRGNKLRASQGKFVDFRYIAVEYTPRALMEQDFVVVRQLVPPPDASNSLAVRRRVPLLSASFRRSVTEAPLPFANLRLHLAGWGTFTPQSTNMPDTRTKPLRGSLNVPSNPHYSLKNSRVGSKIYPA